MDLRENSKPRLKSTLYSLGLPDGRLLVLFTPEEQFILPELSTLERETLLIADGCLTVTEIAAALNEKGIRCSTEEVLRRLNYFNRRYMLEDLSDPPQDIDFPDAYREKFQRQTAFFGAWSRAGHSGGPGVQKKMHQAHVVLIGVGGFGSDIFYCLAAMGIGTITAVDFDRVESSNLNRQSMYSEEDVGKFKVDVLEEKTKSMDTSRFTFINRRIDSPGAIAELLGGASLGIITADTPREKIFHWMNRACYQTGVPGLFTSGAAPACIIIGPLVVPGQTSCYACSMPDVPFSHDDPLVRAINNRTTLGVISPYIRTAAGLMSLEAAKHITQFAPCQLYSQTIKMNLIDYGIRIYENASRDNCPFCRGVKKSSREKRQ